MHAVKLTVMFENGEERMVDIKKVEPGDDVFEKPQPGDEVCCNISGGRYSAVVLECIHAEVLTGFFEVYKTVYHDFMCIAWSRTKWLKHRRQ